MAAITSPPPASTSSSPRRSSVMSAEQRIAIRDIPWDLYDRLSDAISAGKTFTWLMMVRTSK